MAINKVIYGGQTLIDLTGDDVTAADVASGKYFHLRDGTRVTGTNTFDADTGDANALASEVLYGKTAYVSGNKITGSMPNNGAVSGAISTAAGTYTIPQGYHDGSGTVGIASAEQAKLVAENIKKDITILGVTGTLEPDVPVTAEAKTATPTSATQVITPSAGYDYLSQVTINPIPYTETANTYGTTVTIG